MAEKATATTAATTTTTTNANNTNNESTVRAKEFHVAPMMGVTYREFRYFVRLLSKRAILW